MGLPLLLLSDWWKVRPSKPGATSVAQKRKRAGVQQWAVPFVHIFGPLGFAQSQVGLRPILDSGVFPMQLRQPIRWVTAGHPLASGL